MTQVGSWTCFHNGCLKHLNRDLSNTVGHACCGRCSEGLDCEERAWGHAPSFPHAYSAGIVTRGVCNVCGHGPH